MLALHSTGNSWGAVFRRHCAATRSLCFFVPGPGCVEAEFGLARAMVERRPPGALRAPPALSCLSRQKSPHISDI